MRLLRANTAIACVLIGVLALAAAAITAGIRARREQARALLAEKDARERLWNAYLAQAQASRLSARRGRREQSLQALSNAAAIRLSPELRTEAIAALTTTDLSPDRPLHPVPIPFRQVFEPGLGRYAITDSRGSMDLYRTADHAHLFRVPLPEGGQPSDTLVADLAFTHDHRHLLIVLRNGAVLRCQLDSQGVRLLRRAEPGRQILGISLGRDGWLVLTEKASSRAHVTLLDADSGDQRVHTFDRDVRGASRRPGTTELALSIGTEVVLWDEPSRGFGATFQHPAMIGVPEWTSDGARFAVPAYNGTIYLWTVDGARSRILSGHSEYVSGLVFSPDDSLLLSRALDNATRLWDGRTGQLIVASDSTQATAFDATGERIGYSQLSQGVGVWRVERSLALRSFTPPVHTNSLLRHLDLTPDGRLLAVLVDGQVHLLDLEGPDAFVAAGPMDATNTQSVAFFPDGRSLLLARNNGLEVRPTRPGPAGCTPLVGAPAAVVGLDGRNLRQATINAQGSRVLIEWQDLTLSVLDLGGRDGPVHLDGRSWSANSQTPATPTGSGRFAISPDGAWVAVGYGVGPGGQYGGASEAHQGAVWDARSGRRTFEIPDPGGVCFSPDGRTLFVRSATALTGYDTASWQCRQRFPLDTLGTHIGALCVLPGAGLIATSRTRQSVLLLDDRTGAEWATLVPPQSVSIHRLRVDSSGRRLVFGTTDQQVLVWDLPAIRGQLALMGLADRALDAAGTDSGLDDVLTLLPAGLVAAAMAVFSGVVVLRRHRRLVQEFVQAEMVVEHRDRQLASARLELLQADKMKALGTLAAGIAHDFNNLLSVIRLSNQLIPRARSQPEMAEYVDAIEQAVLQGKTVVGAMLGYSREGSAQARPMDVGEVVQDTANLLRREFLAGIRLEVQLDPATPGIHFSPGKLQQALLNLIVNAAEAMKGTGTLTLSVRPIGGLPSRPGLRFITRPRPSASFVEVCVQDTGPGIPSEILDRIFEPFFTTKSAGTRKGTGLGLSMVHTMATQNEVGLAVVSVPGQGAAFVLLLPVGSGPAEPSPSSHATQS